MPVQIIRNAEGHLRLQVKELQKTLRGQARAHASEIAKLKSNLTTEKREYAKVVDAAHSMQKQLAAWKRAAQVSDEITDALAVLRRHGVDIGLGV